MQNKGYEPKLGERAVEEALGIMGTGCNKLSVYEYLTLRRKVSVHSTLYQLAWLITGYVYEDVGDMLELKELKEKLNEQRT